MKRNSFIIWILGALLALASIDAIPDPPAIDQHSVVSSQTCKADCSLADRHLNGHGLCSPSHTFQVRWITFASAGELSLLTDRLALTRQASDPSPPFLKAPGILHLQS